MSQMDKLKKLAANVGINTDELLAELKTELVGGIADTVRESIGMLEGKTQEYVDGKFEDFRESVAQVVQARVNEELKPIIGLVEKAKAAQENQPAAADGTPPSNSNGGGGDLLAGREALFTKGIGLLETIIANSNPLNQLQKMGELRRAFYDFEPPGVSPDVQASLQGKTYLQGVIDGAKGTRGKTAPLVEKPGGTSGAPSREQSRRSSPADPGPAKSLIDVIKEIA